MTSSEAGPDPRPAADGTRSGPRHGSRSATRRAAPPWPHDVAAGLLTVAVTVLAGVPVGLLWASLAPRITVVVERSAVDVVDTYGDGFIAVDGYYLAAVLLAGSVGGLLAWRLGAAHGPAVVVGLTTGGLAAAWVAMLVGEWADGTPLQDLVAAGVRGRHELAVQLRSTSALLGWPIASLLTHLLLTLRSAETDGRPPSRDGTSEPVSWG